MDAGKAKIRAIKNGTVSQKMWALFYDEIISACSFCFKNELAVITLREGALGFVFLRITI
jgi:hypothetical protein